ncbi:MAG: hypothetical protein ACOCP4_04970 [Candidatus Woesearchaeota archaeon]
MDTPDDIQTKIIEEIKTEMRDVFLGKKCMPDWMLRHELACANKTAQDIKPKQEFNWCEFDNNQI